MIKILFFLLILPLAGCATGYHPMGYTGGYSEVQLNTNTWQIEVAANGYTSAQRARKIALMRAADLTLKSGATKFIILGGGVNNEYAGSTPVTVSQVGRNVYATGGDSIYKPSGTLVIQIVKKGEPAFENAFDASLLEQQLRKELE